MTDRINRAVAWPLRHEARSYYLTHEIRQMNWAYVMRAQQWVLYKRSLHFRVRQHTAVKGQRDRDTGGDLLRATMLQRCRYAQKILAVAGYRPQPSCGA